MYAYQDEDPRYQNDSDPWSEFRQDTSLPVDYPSASTTPVASGLPSSPGGSWEDIASAYGLGVPPAVGMPTSLPGVQVGQAPMLNTDLSQFNDYMNQIGGQIKGAYGFDTPTANTSLIDPSQIQNPNAQQYGTSSELQRLLQGQGFSPDILAKMRATATEQPAQAGLAQLGQMKRALGESGIRGGAAAALQGDIARQTGQQQGQNMRDIDVGNAQMANQNFMSGVGMQTQIGMGNMQAANQMAMQAADRLFESLRSNQNASNSMNQFNAGNKFNQQMGGANAQSNFYQQQGAQGQDQRYQNERENATKNWDREKMNAGFNWDRQKSQWDELNSRYSGAQNQMGAWGA